jgi:acetyltransferase-like isoleucine patch superfamily enzyme
LIGLAPATGEGPLADRNQLENAVILPPNVRVGAGSAITGDCLTANFVFKRFRSKRDPAIVIGQRSFMDGVLFNLGRNAFVEIGDDCSFHDAVIICESEMRVGNRVKICWHATILDSDFHPLDPAERVRDAISLSPLDADTERPTWSTRPVVIEDDVWIGPNALVLKGVRIGAGAVVEPGAVVTSDVVAGTRVIGNPARLVSDVRA